MTDTPNIRDMVSESIPEVEAEVVETPEAQPSATVETKEEAPQTESFTEKGDLTGKTPEQLEEIYQNWQKAYTTKRQTETQQLKELQAKIAELEGRTQQVQTVEQKAETAREQVELGQMTVPEYTEYIQSLVIEKAREAAQQEYKTMIAEEREQQLASKALEQFQGADPRLDKNSPEHNEKFAIEVQRELADELDKHLEKTGSYDGFDAATLTKQIVDRRDAELDEIIKKRTIQSTQAAKMRDAKARKSEVRGSAADGQSIGGNSIRNILSEAVDSA